MLIELGHSDGVKEIHMGKAIMQHLAKIAVEHTCSRIEWLTVKDKNLSKRFYDAIGATEASHMTIRRLQGPVLTRLASPE
ncbi:N-acetyltransferase [Undibacterium sp. TJN19]|uniref:N-acetyltransferase n=1 Tax=Undibacterium sp. TJN19 TaxID=3413055 RepID=UPI003BEFCB59